jgi:CheY-like chemotaxis protein
MTMPKLERILLVEDDLDIQMVASMALEDLGGFQVEVCSSGLEALEKAPLFDPHLILLDVMMPDLDGLGTLVALGKLPAPRPPVVFMTARAQPNEVEEYHQSGAVDVIVKPFDPMLLSETVLKIWRAQHKG